MSDLSYSADFVAPPPQRNAIFFGPNGLRAGWGLLLFALLAAISVMVTDIAMQVQHLAHPTPAQQANPLFAPGAQITEALFYILFVILTAVLLARRDSFRTSRAALTAALLVFSILLLSAVVFHITQVQKQKGAATQGQKQSPPSSAAASSTTAQEVQTIGAEGFSFAVVLLLTWIMSRVEHRNFGEYGLGGNSRRWPQLVQGLVVGFAALSVLVLGLYLGHWLTFGGALLHTPGAVLKNGMLWLLAFVMVGLFEEFFFRGYMQYTLARGIGFGAIGFFIAAALFNFGFGFVHGGNVGESPIGLWTAGLIGFVFCISLWYTRSLWWAVGFHATWDWGESFFYGTADSGGVSQGRLLDSHPQGKLLLSGGATGPEGSALCLVIILLIALFVWAVLRRERDKATNQALVNPLVDPLVPGESDPFTGLTTETVS